MPGYKRSNYRRTYKSKRHTRRTFSRFNTYKNRSSKSQAYQIYKLNKKINYCYRMNKPEVQIYQTTDSPIDIAVYSDTSNGRAFEIHRCVDQGLDIFNGRIARLKNVVFTGSFRFNGNPASTAQAATGCLRLIFFRPVYQIWGPPALTDILPSNVDGYNNEYFMKCPLQHGFSTKFKLVADYKYYLVPQKSNVRFVNIKLKYNHALKRGEELNTDVHEDFAYPANSLFCISYIARCGEYQSLDTFSCELFMKLAYTDDTGAVIPASSKSIETHDNNDEDINIDTDDTVKNKPT